MPKPGFDVVTIRDEAFRKARRYYKKKIRSDPIHPEPSFSKFISNLIERATEDDRNLSLMRPTFQALVLQENSVVILDHRLGRTVEIEILAKNNTIDLFCTLDRRKDCIHVGFAYSIPKLYRIIGEKSQKLRKSHPKRRETVKLLKLFSV